MVAPQSAGERGFAHCQGWVWTLEQSIHVQQCRAVDTNKQTVSLLQAAPRVLLAHQVTHCSALVSQVKGESESVVQLNCASEAAAHVA